MRCSALVPRIEQCASDVSGRDLIIDEASVLNIVYRLEKLERVNSLDTLEKLSQLLESSVTRTIATERPDFLLDAALYMWEAHCKPLLRQIKIIGERHDSDSADEAVAADMAAAAGAGSTARSRSNLLMTAEEKRRHADARSGLASFTASLIQCLNSLYKVLIRLEFDDQMIFTQIVLELVALLDSRGSEADWRHAVLVLGQALKTLERHRSDLIRTKARDEVGGVIHSIRADFDLHIIRDASSNARPARWGGGGGGGFRKPTPTVEEETKQSADTISRSSGATTPLPPIGTATAGPKQLQPAQPSQRPLCGTLPRVENTLACLHADLLMHLYRIELKLGALHQSEMASTRLAGSVSTSSAAKERVLMERCGANRYERMILLLQMARFRTTVVARHKLLSAAVKLLAEAEAEEEILMALCQIRVETSWRAAMSDGYANVSSGSAGSGGAGGVDADATDEQAASVDAAGGDGGVSKRFYVFDPLNTSLAASVGATTGGAGLLRPRPAASTSDIVLPAPVLVDKTSHTITIRPVVPASYVSKYKLRAVIVYGKAADAGVAVSTHNNELKGVGHEIPVPADGSSEWPAVLVHDLLPNTAYVFATIGVDQSGQL